MKKGNSGFTLLEILIASTVFALSIFALVQTRSTSLRNLVESEKLHEAVQLAGSKMAEYELKLQKQINKNGVTGSLLEEKGQFPAPFDKYSWTASLKENSMKFTVESVMKFLMDMGMDKDTAEAQVAGQAIIMTNINKALKNNYAELKVVVEWDQFGRKMRLPVVTHLIPAKPAISITSQAEVDQE